MQTSKVTVTTACSNDRYQKYINTVNTGNAADVNKYIRNHDNVLPPPPPPRIEVRWTVVINYRQQMNMVRYKEKSIAENPSHL